MSRSARAIAASAALLFSLHMVSLHAQHKPAKAGATPHATKAAAPKTQAPKATAPKAAAPKGSTAKQAKAKAVAPKGATAKATSPAAKTKPATKLAKQKTEKPAKSTVAKHEKKEAAPVKKAASTKKLDSTKTKKAESTKKAKSTEKAEPAATATNTTTPIENLGPVQQKLAKNTNLANKLQSRLPAGTNLMEAADGFRNLGQFVAAVNVSNNLNIPFDKLKANMVDKKMSLGQSIQDLRPATSAAIEAQRAEYDAQGLITQTEHETSLSASATASASTKTTTTTSTTATAKPRKASRKTATGGA